MIIEYTTLLSLLVLSARSAPTDAYVDSLNNTGLAIPEARASGAVALMGRNIHHETTTTLSTEYVDDQDGASVPRQTALQKRNGCGSPNPCDAWTDMTVEVVTTELKTKEKIRWRTTVVQSTQTIVKTSRRKIKTVIKVPAAETPQHPDYPPPNPAPTTYQGDGKLWKAMRKCVDEPPYAPYVRLRYGPRNVVDRVQGGSQLDIKGCGPDLAQTWPGKEVWTYDERAARSLAKGAVIKCQTFILHHIPPVGGIPTHETFAIGVFDSKSSLVVDTPADANGPPRIQKAASPYTTSQQYQFMCAKYDIPDPDPYQRGEYLWGWHCLVKAVASQKCLQHLSYGVTGSITLVECNKADENQWWDIFDAREDMKKMKDVTVDTPVDQVPNVGVAARRYQ